MCDLREAATETITFHEGLSLRWHETADWRVFVDEEGYPLGFEHSELGDEGGSGGLWFDGTHLVDYDGVYDLPEGVIKICERIGFNMDYAKDAYVDHLLGDDNG
jgi:hypothetical protein